MKKLFPLGCSCLLLAATAATAQPPDPTSWYRSGYAPLWEAEPWTRVASMLSYYADVVRTHEVDGGITSSDKHDWLAAPMDDWRAEGWLNSSLVHLQTDRINETTVTFKAGWIDRYRDSEDELSCGWYLADYLDSRWQFTAYADIDCADQGFVLP